MRKTRLWRRLFIAYLFAPAAVLLLFGWLGAGVIERLFSAELANDLEARAYLVAKPIGELIAQNRTAEIDALTKDMGRDSGTRITVVLPSGEVAGDSHRPPRDMDNHGGRPEIAAALAGRTGFSRRYSSTEHEDNVYAAVPVVRDKKIIAVVRVSLPLADLTSTLATVRDRIIFIGFMGLLIHAAVTLVISLRMSRPLEEIKAGAEAFAAGNLAHRLRVSNCLEIGAVAESLNRMAGQLDERIRTVMRQQNERDAMLSSMEEGVLAIDNDGTILSLNAACAEMLGEEPVRLGGRGVYEAIRKADLLQFIESALASHSPVEGELHIRGEEDRWLSARGTALLDPQRGKIGVLVVLHDITRLRHLEQVRRDFVANVSHELRTPITSIKGFVETLADGAIEDRETARRFLQIMLRQVNRLDAIISDLLVLSRIERGGEGQRIELESQSVRAALVAATEMCEKRAADKQLRINLDCPEELFAAINAPLLEQAVVNLLDNAIKYSNPASEVELRAFADGEQLVVQVADHGCGIEARHLPRLFERFYRVDKARSRELGGTGLGLAIVRHIALAHRGTVGVESIIGQGSTFTLRLPIAPQKSES